MQRITKYFISLDGPTKLSLGALLVGQALFLVGFRPLYVVALSGLLAVGLPYPRVMQSILARVVAGVLLGMSVLQVAGALQFFVLPGGDFGALSVITTVIVLGLVYALRSIPRQSIVMFDRKDLGGIVTALFFALPFAVLCFWGNDLAHITTFASVQGSDGANHYTAIAEMSKDQHLNYRTVAYYPKGFHLASAFVLHGLSLNQPDQDWAGNARVYAGLYVVWGVVLAYVVFYAAAQMAETFSRSKRPPLLLLALALGPPLALMYLCIFGLEGFLNFYYICAAVLCGAMFLYDAALERRDGQWPVVASLLLFFGIAMSWGPLLTPALLLMPALYLWPLLPGRPKALARLLVSREWRWITLVFVLQLVPLYLHVRYAHLSSQQGLNATGGIRAFHYGPFLAGLAIMGYLLVGRSVDAAWRKLAGNVLLPLSILVGVFACIQYISVGELRYYAIKTSYLFEIIALVAIAVVVAEALQRSRATALQRWLALPTIVGLGMVMLAGVSANPFQQARSMFGPLVHSVRRIDPDVLRYTQLGSAGVLATNVVDIHENPAHTLSGNAPLTNWANLMQYATDSRPADGLCSGRIFSLETSPLSSGNDQNQQLTVAVKDCIAAANARQRPFYIVTDAGSAPQLRDIFGSQATYVY